MSDTTMPKTVRVSRDQVSAARALIRLRGGVDKVDPSSPSLPGQGRQAHQGILSRRG